jgi:hypothetical protein
MEMMELKPMENEGGNVEDIRGNRWIRSSLTVTVPGL